MANNNASTTRPVNGGNGDDVLTGDGAANLISGGSGDDTLTGGGGEDVLKGDAGRDLLDGGAGSDRVDGHSEDDVLVYVAAENAGAHDEYDGGAGVDTLRLVLTRDEWMRPAVQTDIAAFLAFISGQANPSGQATAGVFAFTAFDLTAGKFERLEVTVDGVPLDPRDEAVTLAGDASQTDEDGTASGAVLANDAVPDLVRSVEVVAPPAHGTLVFNADGTYLYTPGAHFNSMAAGETATETFQYKVTDADFDSALAMVTVTITGTNDGPVVTNTAQELVGAVQEDGASTATGQLSATDVDHDATQTWTVEGAATGSYGSITVDANGRWVYTLDNAAHQDLAQGESHQEAFTIRVSDDQGAFVDQVVTVSVTGTNDGPVITGGATSGSVTEDAAATQATGQLVADDPDHGAQEIWTVVGGTPSGSADYLFTMDRLTVTRNGQPYFTDEFSDGLPPPSGGGPFSYVGATLGALAETGGRLVFDGANAMPFVGVGTPDPIVGGSAVLRTNIDPASPGGLKSSTDFTVSGVFDLVEPDSPRETYGIRLTDRLVGGPGTPPDQLGNNAIEVRVIARTNGTTVVAFRHLDFVSDTATVLQAIPLAAPSGADQIRINLAHAVANMGQVAASFEYLSGGVVVGSQAFTATGPIFQGENWTRAEVIASAPAINDSTLGGTYGTLTVAQSGAWTYDIDNGRAATQALAQGEVAADSFTVQVADEFGAFDTRTIDVQVVGTNDGPVIQTAEVSRGLAEDANVAAGLLTATGEGQFSDVDLADAHSVSAVLAAAQLSDGAPLPAGLAAALGGAMTTTLLDAATGDGHAQYRWDFGVANAATQFVAAGQTLQLTYDVVATDSQGASAAQRVTITIAGTNDVPVVAAADVTGAVTEMTAPAGVLTDSGTIAFSDADLADVHGVGAVTASAPTLGTLTASVTADTTGTGAGGVVTWNYSVPASSVEYLRAGQARVESFSFDVLDGHGGSVPRTVAVTITGTNDKPVAVGDVLAAAEDSPVTFTAAQLLGNDSDADANAQLSIASVASGVGGTAVRNLDGSVTFKPFANFSGAASFSYVASDGSAQSNAATVTVNVAPVNDAPALTVPLSGATSMWNGEGNALDLIGGNNGTLYNGTSFAAGHIGQAFSFDGANDFTRVLNQIPNDFTISAWINTSNPSRTGTQFHHGDGLIYADVGGVTTDFGISILNNRIAFGTGGYQDITIQSQSTVTSGNWVQFSAVRSGSVISLYVNGVLEASANTGYAGPLNAPSHINFGGNTIDSRYYRGLLDDVTIYDRALSAAEIQSVVAGQPAITTAEDTARTMTTIRVSDVDAGADSLLVSLAAAHGALALGSTAGLTMVDADGSDGSLSFTGSIAAVNARLASGLTYVPDANYHGADQLSLAVNDQGRNGSGGALAASQNVAITVTPVNDAPVAVDDANALTVKALPSGAQSNFVNWVNWTSSAPGSVVGTIDLGGGQTIGVTYTGEFTFAQTNGGTNFYTDHDNNGSPTTTTYTSPAVQNGPTGWDIIALSQATQKTLTFSQPVNDLFFAIVSLNGNGYLFDQDFDIMSYGQGYFGNGSATRVALPDGRFSVVGNNELHGVLRIDGAVQSLTWTSQTPEYWNGFTVGTYGKAQTATVTGNVLGNDSDADGDTLAVSAVNGQQIVGNSVTLDLASGARVQVNKDGTYLYDEDGAFGSLVAGQTTFDSFQYTVADGQGGASTATVRIAVTGVNDAATIAGSSTGSVSEDGTLTTGGTLTVSDIDTGESTFAVASSLSGTYGTFTFDGGAWTYTLDNATARVQALGAADTVYDTLNVQSVDGTAWQEIRVSIGGADERRVPTVLFVDDDGGINTDVTWLATLRSLGYNPAYESIAVNGDPLAALGGFDVVVWAVGDRAYTNLTSQNAATLKAYLDGGGNLLYAGGHNLYEEPQAGGFISSYLGLSNYAYNMPQTTQDAHLHTEGPGGTYTLSDFSDQPTVTSWYGGTMSSAFAASSPSARLLMEITSAGAHAGHPGAGYYDATYNDNAAINYGATFRAATWGFDLNQLDAPYRAEFLDATIQLLGGAPWEVVWGSGT